jgi:DNA-binding GntR family transcriptional regulator
VTAIPSLVELDPSQASSVPQAMPTRLYGLIKHRVLTGQLKPGVRIIETELSAEFSVSRTPLREALNRLAHEGLLVLNPYKGYSVTPLSIAHFRELCELRRILEPEAAALAAARATAEDIASLRSHAVLSYTPKNPNSYGDYLRANGSFHLALVRSTRNRMLEGMVMSALDRHQRPCYLGLDVGIDSTSRSSPPSSSARSTPRAASWPPTSAMPRSGSAPPCAPRAMRRAKRTEMRRQDGTPPPGG